tara:strand:- start:139 stop:2109 length:1971 start_codon:yes stop_codon:yes gene_type:complete
MSVYNRKLFKNSRPARDMLNQAAGIMASSAPLMQEVQRFQGGGTVDPRLLADADRASRMERVAAAMAADPRARTLGVGGLSGLLGPKGRELLGLTDAAQAEQSSLSGLLGPRGRELLGLTNATQAEQPNDITASEVLTDAQGTGEFTPLNPEVSPFDTFPVDGRSVVSPDGAVSSQPVTMPPAMTPIPGSGMTPIPGSGVEFPTLAEEEAAKAAGSVKDSVKFPTLAEEEAAKAAGSVKDPTLSEQTNPGKTGAEAVIETVEKMSTENPDSAVKSVENIVSTFLANDDQESASDTLLAAHGELDPDEPLSTDERIEKMRETIRKFYGRDPGEERRIDGLNLAMMGFAAAAGDSPNALKNLADGALVGVKAMKEEKQRRQAREDKITGLAVSTILGREEKESDRAFRKDLLDISNKHDLRKFALQDASAIRQLSTELNFRALLADQDRVLKLDLKNADIDIANAGLKSRANELATRLEAADKIARDDRSSREQIAEAEKEMALLRTTITNLPDGYGIAFLEGKNKNLKGSALIDFALENGQKFAADTLLTGPDSLKRRSMDIIPQIMKEQEISFDDASRAFYNSPQIQSMFGDQITSLNIPLVEVADDEGPTGQKLVVGSIISGSTKKAVSSLDLLKKGEEYFVVQTNGTLSEVKYK